MNRVIIFVLLKINFLAIQTDQSSNNKQFPSESKYEFATNDYAYADIDEQILPFMPTLVESLTDYDDSPIIDMTCPMIKDDINFDYTAKGDDILSTEEKKEIKECVVGSCTEAGNVTDTIDKMDQIETDISLLHSDDAIIGVHSMDINRRAMDVSWFGIADNIDNEFYAGQNEFYGVTVILLLSLIVYTLISTRTPKATTNKHTHRLYGGAGDWQCQACGHINTDSTEFVHHCRCGQINNRDCVKDDPSKSSLASLLTAKPSDSTKDKSEPMSGVNDPTHSDSDHGTIISIDSNKNHKRNVSISSSSSSSDGSRRSRSRNSDHRRKRKMSRRRAASAHKDDSHKSKPNKPKKKCSPSKNRKKKEKPTITMHEIARHIYDINKEMEQISKRLEKAAKAKKDKHMEKDEIRFVGSVSLKVRDLNYWIEQLKNVKVSNETMDIKPNGVYGRVFLNTFDPERLKTDTVTMYQARVLRDTVMAQLGVFKRAKNLQTKYKECANWVRLKGKGSKEEDNDSDMGVIFGTEVHLDDGKEEEVKATKNESIMELKNMIGMETTLKDIDLALMMAAQVGESLLAIGNKTEEVRRDITELMNVTDALERKKHVLSGRV